MTSCSTYQNIPLQAKEDEVKDAEKSKADAKAAAKGAKGGGGKSSGGGKKSGGTGAKIGKKEAIQAEQAKKRTEVRMTRTRSFISFHVHIPLWNPQHL